MRRVAAASLAVLVGAIGGCGGAGDSSNSNDDQDADADVVRFDARPETESIDTAPEPDTAPEIAPDTAIETAPEVGPTCTGEETEPNDRAIEAVPLGTIDDCDSSGSTLHGVLSSASDVDYWHFQGNDTFGCSVDPTVSTTQSVKLCVFVACLHGPTEVKGCTDSTPTLSDEGLHGCCTDGPGDAVVDFTCTLVGSDDSADVYIRVEDPSASSCEHYDVAYHY
jgi:hypothetical protein